jgi:hypothetical protein
LKSGRGTQVVRERSAKPLCVGSIPTRASKIKAAKAGINTAFPNRQSKTLWILC